MSEPLKFKTIKIGSRKFKIIDNIKFSGKPAYVNPFTRIMGITSSLKDLDKLVSIFHESLHVVLLEHGFDHEYHDEKLISTIAGSVVDLIINNSDLIDFIDEFKEDRE